MSDLIDRQAAIDGKICIQRANGVEIYDDYAVPVEYLKQLPSAQPEINCSEFPNNSDTISRQAAIYIASGYCHPANIAQELAKLPSVEPQIIYCKDCAKHNKRIGDYEELPVGGKWIWKENACPLIEFRGKAHGHEFDYQFCAYGERREVTE